jgi:hypothetical protein
MSIPRGLVLSAVVATAGVACKERERAEPTSVAPGSGSPATMTPDDEGASYGDAPRTVSLEHAGTEPRRVVTYAMTGPKREPPMSIAVVIPDGRGNEMASLALRAKLVWVPAGPRGDRTRHDFRVSDLVPTRDPTMGDDEWRFVGTLYKAFEQVTGRAYVSATGETRVAQVDGLPTTPSVPALVHTAIVPLPAAPIGLGARWHTEQALPPGMGAEQENRTYELIAVAGDTLTVQLVGQLSITASAPGAGVAVDGFRITGEIVIDLADPLPRSALIEHALEASAPSQDLARPRPKARFTIGL